MSLTERRRSLPGLLLILALGLGCRPNATGVFVGGPAPALDLPALDASSFSPAQVEGKVVVVDFWATWCGPCHIQADILARGVVPTWRPRGVEFVGVDVGEAPEVVRGWLADHPAPYPILLDENEELFSIVSGRALPTLLVIDKNGRIAHLSEGIVDKDELGEILARAGA